MRPAHWPSHMHPAYGLSCVEPATSPSNQDSGLMTLLQYTLSTAMTMTSSSTAYSAAELKTYHCECLGKLPLTGLDLSMLKDELDWKDFRNQVWEVHTSLISLSFQYKMSPHVAIWLVMLTVLDSVSSHPHCPLSLFCFHLRRQKANVCASYRNRGRSCQILESAA